MSILKGRIIVNFGDSIFGNTQDETSVSAAIMDQTQATVYNLGFGGCRMGTHGPEWDAFCMYALADAIVAQDFAKQDQALVIGDGIIPAYFARTVSIMKTVDFQSVDMVTIAYGTNDYTAGVSLDNELDVFDVNTFMGALRYSLRRLMAAFPHLKILVLTPTYRFWTGEAGEFLEDSDTKMFNGLPLTAFVTAVKTVCCEFKTPYLDNYHDLGINRYNRARYFRENDGTHLNAAGNRKLGEKIASQLMCRF